jgi:hypothetical protein
MNNHQKSTFHQLGIFLNPVLEYKWRYWINLPFKVMISLKKHKLVPYKTAAQQ